MKERNCELCEEILNYQDFCNSNMRCSFDTHMKTIWESRDIQLICCSCKKKIKKLGDPNEKYFYKLSKWAKNGILKKLEKYGIVSRKDIIKMERLRKEGKLIE